MFKVLHKESLTPKAFVMEVQAPHLASAQPGQYAVVQRTLESERVPLSILETTSEGARFLVEVRGRSTLELDVRLNEEPEIAYIEGPAGVPFEIRNYGRVLLISKNWGLASLFAIGKALNACGNSVSALHVGDTLENVYMIDELQSFCESVRVLTEDGSLEEGNVEIALRDYLDSAGKPDLVVCAGSNLDSSLVVDLCKREGIEVMAMVNTYMLDTIGLCLVCRVMVKGEQKLACVDGPWFRGDEIEWDYLLARENIYEDEEKQALEKFLKQLERERLRSRR